MSIYSRRGDDGTTRLFRGGRVAKDSDGPESYGTIDEAVSFLGVARARADAENASAVLAVQRDLFVVAAELATDPNQRDRLEPGISLVEASMIDQLEERIDRIEAGTDVPTEFTVPGGEALSASLDVARSVVRRAERAAVTRLSNTEGSLVVPYLNRLADYLYLLARVIEKEWTPTRGEKS